MSKLQTNRSYFYLLLADRIFVVLLFLFLFFGLLRTRTGIFVVVLFFLYQAVMLAVFCVRFLGPLREIEKISEMIAQPERHMADLEGGRPIHRLIQYVKQSVENEYTSQMLASQAEIHALQSQINPHFLYNTLDTIVWMAEFNDSERVIALTKSLAAFFRLSLNGGRELVSVADELDHMRQYLYIQKERYGDKLNYEIGEADELSDYTVPKIILQPVVENSIYHGIKPLDGPGYVTVTVKEMGERLIFTVADNGVGFNPEEPQTGKRKGKGSVGLKNVHRRLKSIYGEDNGLKIESSQDGSRVWFRVPMQPEPDQEPLYS